MSKFQRCAITIILERCSLAAMQRCIAKVSPNSVRSSVRLSQTGIVEKRIQLRSRVLHRRIILSSLEIQRESPRARVSNHGGVAGVRKVPLSIIFKHNLPNIAIRQAHR